MGKKRRGSSEIYLGVQFSSVVSAGRSSILVSVVVSGPGSRVRTLCSTEAHRNVNADYQDTTERESVGKYCECGSKAGLAKLHIRASLL